MQSNRDTTRGDWPTTQVSLLEQLQSHEDTSAWNEFVSIYGPLVMHYCRRRGLQESDAGDIAQDVLLQVSKGISDFRYDPNRGRFRNWLGTITYRAMRKHVARSRRAVAGMGKVKVSAESSIEERQQPLGETWTVAFNAYVYRIAVERLQLHFDAETWRAFEATFVENRAPEEVGAELKRTVGWVYQAKSKVVRRLKEEILYLAEDSAFLNLQNRQVSRE